MPLSKRRRLFTPKRNKLKPNIRGSETHTGIETQAIIKPDNEVSEVSTARGRLKGALMEMMEPVAEESDASSDYIPAKRERNVSQEQKGNSSEEEERPIRRKSPQRQSYVLKLFDRSVDLSQFSEDSPLYPICRAWIANQPKVKYRDFAIRKESSPPPENTTSIELPGPEGPVISRIPNLLPEQRACSKDNINLNYRSSPHGVPSKQQLLRSHAARWAAVRGAWLERAARVEARYSATQDVLNRINSNTLQ